ncbi:hypothetical protein C1751_07210 [Pseudomonas fluorescens]|nr:hypothetical protein C1751_07210 [Pseudomonas fluorescens]
MPTFSRANSGRCTPDGSPPLPVGASLLAKNFNIPRSIRQHALSLWFFASKLAPTFCFQVSDFMRSSRHSPWSRLDALIYR